jgi:flagellar basal body rod protein FlgG
MFLSPALSAALDRIADRAADVRRAFTPASLPQHDDVATPRSLADFTLDPLSVTAPEGAYFVTRDDAGRRSYTRDGAFALAAGKLVDANGQAVLGVRAGSAAPVELSIDGVDLALGRIRSLAIERDGSLVYRREVVDPRSGGKESQRVVVGRIALARFPAGTKLAGTDGSHGVPPEGLAPVTGLAGEGGFAPVWPMHRERSRVDVDASLARLKDAYLAFDALQAAEAAKAHLGKTTMDLLK